VIFHNSCRKIRSITWARKSGIRASKLHLAQGRNEQLKKLIEKAVELHNNKKELAESKKVRLILGGGGRKQKLTPESQIILTLTYLRHLTTFQLLGI
jgi:hypothetical protein